MEVKDWGYDEFPEFNEAVEGAHYLDTTGDEKGVRCIANVEYKTEKGIIRHIQILQPFTRNTREKALTLPCVVFVQGSGWAKQNIFEQIPMVSNLALYDYVVAVVEYRGSDMASFPATIIDTRNAVRFLRTHAKEYGIDPKRMVIMGDSSGGHAAAYAGIMHDDESAENQYPGVSAEVSGLIDLYGSVTVMLEDGNPSTLNHHLPDSPEGMEMGGVNLREHPELCRKLSVECNITPETQIAPVLMFHGTKDRTVNTRQSVVLYRKLKECGKDVQLYFVRGGDHGGPEYWTAQVLDIVDQFIKNCFIKEGRE